jgi:hypothetical protein
VEEATVPGMSEQEIWDFLTEGTVVLAALWFV